MSKITALYLRTAQNDPEAMELQKNALLYGTKERGYKNLEIYADCGYSGTKLDRPDMNRLTEDIQNGKVGRVMAMGGSVICRDFIKLAEWVENLRECKVKLDMPNQIEALQLYNTPLQLVKSLVAVNKGLNDMERERLEQLYRERQIRGRKGWENRQRKSREREER